METTSLVKPEQSERSTAAAVHIGAIFVPIWVPLIAYFVTRKRREFVAAHARQSLVETLVLNVLIGIAMLGSLCYTVWRVYTLYQGGVENIDWSDVIWQSLLRLGVWWLAMGVLWLINTIVSVRQAMQALRGEWPKSVRKRAARGR